MTAVRKDFVSWRMVNSSEIDFHNATPVISAVQKYIVPVPEFPDGGEPLVYPDGHEQSGEPVLGWDKTPVGEKGVVFWNDKDSCWQAAADDGTHVVIFNNVSEREATLLHEKFCVLGGSEQMTFTKFKDFIAYATEIGLTDAYQSDREYVNAFMTPVRDTTLQLEYAGVTMGFVKRDDRAIAYACYKEGPFEFVNAAGVTQQMPNGGVIVQLGDAIHAVQPDIFRQTYNLADGGRTIRDCAVDIEHARLTDT